MPKTPQLYLKVDPYKIIEEGFHQNRSKVSESIFSLANEYMGVRGFFDEDYSGDKLIGTYFNGIYDYAKDEVPNAYLGIVKRSHFTLNSINFFKLRFTVDEELLDLNKSKFSDFYRSLDMTNGLYERSFLWNTKIGDVNIKINRLLSMNSPHLAFQEITLSSSANIKLGLDFILDGNTRHWGDQFYFKPGIVGRIDDVYYLGLGTLTTNQKVLSLMKTTISTDLSSNNEYVVTTHHNLKLVKGKEIKIRRYIVNIVDKGVGLTFDDLLTQGYKELKVAYKKSTNELIKENKEFYNRVYAASDIEIEGDDKNQQGIRYCIFQLAQTYHGYMVDNNIGAKGLTGEAYSGHAFWDSEVYCLPFYLFNNQVASKNLLMFRYNTLKQAKERARMLDCEGACYPIATRNGEEGCTLWQHASLQFQPSTAVFYGIIHYMNLYHDESFLKDYGLEMIIEIAKFLLSRGSFNQDGTKFGFYGVMGPDEFQMMVNHNTYTNFMAKKVFDYLLANKDKYPDIYQKFNLDDKLLSLMKEASDKMVILYDEGTKLFEQHQGFFDLPHVDISKIDEREFPLYSHWSYDRIYRNDMIKQPDVLMFMFLYNQDFSLDEKKANYDYYEPKCIHESSLSPSIHSIFAEEIGYDEAAYNFFGFATRLDLDDYNRNTCEGIHMTSIAAAWMNIVYGFGGLRSDRDILKIAPKIPNCWKSYSFKLSYNGALIKIKRTKEVLIIETDKEVVLNIYNKDYQVKGKLILEI